MINAFFLFYYNQAPRQNRKTGLEHEKVRGSGIEREAIRHKSIMCKSRRFPIRQSRFSGRPFRT